MLQRKGLRPELSQRPSPALKGSSLLPRFFHRDPRWTNSSKTVDPPWQASWLGFAAVCPAHSHGLQLKVQATDRMDHIQEVATQQAWLVTFICGFCTMLLGYSGSLHMVCGPAPSSSLPIGCAMLHRWTDGQMNPEHWSQVSTVA